MTIKITGIVIRGEGNASRNHSVLIPLLAKNVPAIASCSQFGTINIRLDQSLDKSRADVWTPRIVWHPVNLTPLERSGRLEIFGFTQIRFECPLEGSIYKAWILMPEGSRLTYRDDEIEVIADTFIQGVEYGARCAIHIDHVPAISAPPSFGVLYGMTVKAKL